MPQANSTYQHTFYGGATELMRIRGDGNVGLGTPSPAYMLDVNGAINAAAGFKVGGGKPSTSTYLKGNGISFIAGSILAADIPSLSSTYVDLSSAQTVAGIKTWSGNAIFNGNVGIGASGPTNKLEVAGNTKTTNFQMTSGASNTFVMQGDGSGNGTWVNPSTLAVSNIYSADGSLSGARTVTMAGNNLTLNATTGNLVYNPSSTGKMAVGTVTPLGSAILTVSGTSVDPMYLKSTATESDIAYQNAANGSWQAGTNDAGNGTSGNQFYIYDANASSYNLTVQRGGNVGVATASPLAKMDVNGGLLVRGTNTNTSATPISAAEFMVGRQSNGTLAGSQTTADIALEYGGGGFRHYIQSRHNSVANSNANAIDFYLNNSTVSGGSSTPGTGNVNMMSLTAIGVGINGNNAPTALLDVKGSDWNSGGTGSVMINNPSASVGPTLRFNGPSHVFDVIGSTGAGAGVGAGCFAIWDNTAAAYRMSIAPAGAVTVNNLAGSGYRTVYADANGVLSTVTTPTASTNSTSAAIADNTCTGQPAPAITVSGQPTSIATNSISVTLNLNHTWDGDLSIFLVAPNGAILLLADRVGGSGDNFTSTVFSDGASTAISAGSAPFTGTFRPSGTTTAYCSTTGTATSFGAIGGGTINPNGTWTLKIFDNSSGDVGTFLNWSISFGTPGGPRTVQFLDTRTGCPLLGQLIQIYLAVVSRWQKMPLLLSLVHVSAMHRDEKIFTS